jgi:hypothetical protein
MDRHSDFFYFVMLILIDGDDATVRAFDRALEHISAQQRQQSRSSLYPKSDLESGLALYSDGRS